MITASIVLYKTDINELKMVVNSFSPDEEKKLYLIDNSPIQTDLPSEIINNRNIIYRFLNENKGYGSGHNVAIKEAIINNSKYHFILNPDILFECCIIEKITKFMDEHEKVGLLMPKVFNTDGSLQYVYKLLPTPANMFLRGFLSKLSFSKKMNECFEMHNADFNKILRVPYISGCFMTFRISALKEIGLFDENIFMNFEDTDISRRVAAKYETVMYPEVSIIHKWNRESHKSRKMFIQTIKSAIYYFNKYGWFLDFERRKINKEAIDFNFKKDN